MTPLLDIRALSVSIERPDGMRLPILADLSFALHAGETLGIVGESGSGKSMLALALLGLLPDAARADGAILLDGRDLLRASEAELCSVRGSRIGMIFQEPMSALNPAMRIGDQIAEGPIRSLGLSRREGRARALALLDRVRIADAARRIDAFPHELSGGQRQRVAIAIALALEPALLVADEPTSALDTTVQAEVLDILAELTREAGMALILVSHDLGTIARATERTLVLYAGTRFEEGPTRRLLLHPLNPYTRGLLAARPRRRGPAPGGAPARLEAIPGAVPSFAALPPGCRFAPRCPDRVARCEAAEPAWRAFGPPGGMPDPPGDAFGSSGGVRCIRAAVPRNPA